MPTALDRIQVLLRPEEYAEVSLLAAEERRSLASMAAVLINEAIKQRIREGTFTPNPEDPSYTSAKRRQVARAIGQKVSRTSVLDGIEGLETLGDLDVELVSKKASPIENLSVPSVKKQGERSRS
jgi:hypothetical protein